ncbi:MAG: hypothetical protein IJV80_02855 [Clostridia bacterium]|nr:hypothetical protein [Clostridia bacterium]
MEEKLLCLMKTIEKRCGEGEYHVFADDDFLECFCCDGEENTPQKEELSSLIHILAERGFIGVKYAREGMYCLCARSALKEFFETKKREEVRETERLLRETDLQKKEFLVAFAGGAAGAAAATVVLRLLALLF